MTDLSSRALLVSLNISQWTARKLDKRESLDVATRNGAARGSARVNKSLLPSAHSLDKVSKLAGAIRTYYYKHTLPWIDTMAIIKSEGYIEFARVFGDFKREWEAAVDEFRTDYPRLRADAQQMLGLLYDEADYPHPDTVARKFRLDVSFYPVPSATDWRVDLADGQLDSLREQITAKVVESQGKAMRDLWQRLFDTLGAMAKQLAPDATIRTATVENVRELCALLPSLNIADDPDLERLRCDLERSFCRYDADDLRDNGLARQRASDQLDAIMAKMGGLNGR